MTEKYNGWANYETWRINLEMFDGSSARDWRPRGGEGLKKYVAGLAGSLRDHAQEVIEETSEGFALGLAESFLERVDWREIAEHLAEDEAEELADEADEAEELAD